MQQSNLPSRVFCRSAGSSWGRFWYIVDRFMHKTALDGTEQRAQAESTVKRTDESFRQFFWNNFIQEEGVVFYDHDIVRTGEASTNGSTEIQTDNVRAASSRDECLCFGPLQPSLVRRFVDTVYPLLLDQGIVCSIQRAKALRVCRAYVSGCHSKAQGHDQDRSQRRAAAASSSWKLRHVSADWESSFPGVAIHHCCARVGCHASSARQAA